MSVSTGYASKVTTTEVPATNVPAMNASRSAVLHDGFDTAAVLDGTTAPAVTDCAFDTYALVAGALTIDLTALKELNDLTLDLSAGGKRPRLIKVRNTAAHPITVAKGATNGWSPVAGAAFSVPIPAGGEALLYDGGNAAAVDATHKTLDVTGTGTDAFQVGLVAGP